ncbi:type II secretion system protein GspL [Motiliproteus coralliicola]|uniref:type II secretion system protein GspL n=1 Tax=Motiliproteus coralliicola TaxID=2283196 RepID=UPI000E08EFAB|nr:type II secretion system protein GspL [Motiliproteus coralliicola]
MDGEGDWNMNVKWLVCPTKKGGYRWWAYETADEVLPKEGGVKRLSADVGRDQLALVWPSERTNLHQVYFSRSERKHLNKSVPYSLEESLASEVDELHFALAPADSGCVPVAVSDRTELDQVIAEFSSSGIEIAHVWPEQLLLPWETDHWTLWLDNERCVVRYAEAEGFAIELDTLPLALQLLHEEADQLPQSVDIYCEASSEVEFIEVLPSLLQPLTNRQGGFSCYEFKPDNSALDLLQGDFGKKVDWAKVCKVWRWPMLLLILIVGFQFGLVMTENQLLKKQQDQLRFDIESAFRSAVPQGVMTEPELQLRRMIQKIRVGTGDDTVGFFYQIGTVLNGHKEILLKSVNYHGRDDEFQLNVLAGAFSEVETLREELEKEGFQAELIGTSSENGRTLARLRVKREL